MSSDALPSFNADLAIETAKGVVMDVTVRDRLDLNPARISHAVRARALRGLRAAEAFVRRLLILLALQFEHEISVDVSPREHLKKKPPPRRPQAGPPVLRVFLSEHALPPALVEAWATQGAREGAHIEHGQWPAAPILSRIARLKLVLQQAEARGKRLAYVLARRRHGVLFAPLPLAVPGRMGLEFSHLYRSYARLIRQLSCARPPPARPRPPPRPRIRQL